MAKAWTAEQSDAMNTTGRNILVSAAAGSGKTAVLVERIVKKITDENKTDIDRLVVVTFTKAAAAEMKARIRNRLDDMLDEDVNNTNLVKQIALINNAQITTIDSFCLWILKNHFSEINLDPGFRVADKGEITLLENDVMQELLEDYYKEGDEQFIAIIDAYGTGRSDANIEEIIKKIYVLARSNPWPDEWYRQVVDTYAGIDNSNNKALANLYESILYSVRDYKKKYEYMIKVCNRPDGPVSYLAAINSDYMNICRITEAEDFDELSERIRKIEFERLITKKMPDARDDLKEYVKGQRDKFKKYISGLIKSVFTSDIESLMKDVHANAPAIEMMVRLSKDFQDRMQEEKKDRGIVEFSDIEHYALDILVNKDGENKEYTNVADELAEYFDEILIDEYQDSNQLQEEILTAVSKGRRDDEPDNMYMVGDVKQSIYKFRLACPELFMNKYYSYEAYHSGKNDSLKEKDDGVKEKDDDQNIDGKNDTAEIQSCIISDTSIDLNVIENKTNSESCKIELQKNFRSRKNVLDTTNDVFYRVMNRNYCGIEYDVNQQLNCGFNYPECIDKRNFGWEDEKGTEIVLIDTSNDDENSNVEAEAMYAVKRIHNIMSDKKTYYVYDTDISDYRRIRYSDIAILTRTLTGWADTIVNVLLDNDIPAMAETAQQYFKVREIKILISLLTCIDNPLQDIPMAAVLLSYFGGFTEDELAVLRIYGKQHETDKLFIKQMQKLVLDVCGEGEKNALNEDISSTKDNVIDDSKIINDNDKKETGGNVLYSLEKLSSKCQEFLEKLSVWRSKSRLMTIYDLLWDIVYNTGYYDYTGTMPAGKKRQSNIDVLLDKASSFEGTSYSGLFNFLRYIERLQKYDIELTDSSGTGGSKDAVRVMSIHKSKGLEFPVVFIAGLNKQINKSDARNRFVIDQELGIGTDYVNLDKHTKTSTIIKGAISRKILRDSIAEEERVLYVAMTRAREKLIMMGSMSGIDKKMATWQQQSSELAVEGMFSYAECENIDKYSDMVVPVALMSAADNSGVFDVKIISSEELNNSSDSDIAEYKDDDKNIETNDKITYETLDKAIDETIDIELGRTAARKTKRENTEIDIDDKDASNKAHKVHNMEEESVELPPYIKDPDADRKVKVTVSELKQMQADADYDNDAFMPEDMKRAYAAAKCDRINKKRSESKDKKNKTDKQIMHFQEDTKEQGKIEEQGKNKEHQDSKTQEDFVPTIPKFISNEKEVLRANERGTAYHRVMECLDYSKVESQADVKADIKRMVDTERMSKLQAKNIKAADIYAYISSPIGQRVKKAVMRGEARREQPFVFEYDRQLIQGVIDLYIIEDNKIVIVDYKTDRVRKTKTGEAELVKRYSVQLDYYAKALSQLTGLEVKEKIIYSFALGKQINC